MRNRKLSAGYSTQNIVTKNNVVTDESAMRSTGHNTYTRTSAMTSPMTMRRKRKTMPNLTPHIPQEPTGMDSDLSWPKGNVMSGSRPRTHGRQRSYLNPTFLAE